MTKGSSLHPYVAMQLQNYLRDAELVLTRVNAARTVRDIAGAMHQKPAPHAYIRWASEVKSISHRIDEAAEHRATTLLREAVEECITHMGEPDNAQLLEKIGRVHKDMQLLRGHTPRAIREATKAISAIKRQAEVPPSQSVPGSSGRGMKP